ncbi:MAG: trypsin-like peptidase domain-containing protein [Terriglobia bacterium]
MKSDFSIRRYWVVFIIAAALGVGILIGIFASGRGRLAGALPDPVDSGPLSAPSPASLSSSFARVAARLTPAVVNVKSESVIRLTQKGSHNGAGPHSGLFDHFFGLGPQREPYLTPESLGSGVILDKNGYILTNYHVITDESGRIVDMIRVHLQGDDDNLRGYDAKVVGYDKLTDLAVLKINAGRSLPTAQLGNSDAVRVGDWVLAIGSPFGLNASVTAGIVSAKGREFSGSENDEFKSFLQTDAAINPGNSGGPLVNLSGQVVGINTAIATTRGAYDGVGFAIPSKLVRKVYNDIVERGAVRRGAIGVKFMQLQTPALLQSFGARHGVVVQSVTAGSPAARAGIQRGDVITAIDSRQIQGGSELLNVVSNSDPGHELSVDFLRDGRRMNCRVLVADWNKIAGVDPEQARIFTAPAAPASRGIGVAVKDLAPGEAKQLASQLHLGQASGVMVEEVEPGSFADDLALQRFDVILSVNRRDVHSVAEFNRVQSQLKSGQDVLLMIARSSRSGYATFFLADRLP